MKKVIAWPVAQVCYYLGHWTSLVMNRLPGIDEVEPGRLFDALFAVYQFFMRVSFRLSEWADIGIWRHADAETEPPR